MIAFILSSKFFQLFNFQCLILGFLDFYFYRVLHLNLCIWRQLMFCTISLAKTTEFDVIYSSTSYFH